jgi:hypothetical protein
MSIETRSRTCALVFLSSALTAQSQWTVGPGGQFTDIPPAIAAARSGDRILVIGAGPFSSFTLSRGIDIQATNAVVPSFAVVGVPATETARVDGFGAAPYGVTVTSCRGPVVLQNLSAYHASDAAVRLTDCSSVSLDHVGGSGVSGIVIDRSTAAVAECSFQGNCFGGSSTIGCSGGTGLFVLSGSFAFLANSSFTGAPGTSGRIAGGSGGSGIYCYGTAVAVDVICQGFPGASGGFFNGSPGHAIFGPVRCTAGSSVNTPLAGGAVRIPDRTTIRTSSNLWILGASATLSFAGGADGPMLLAADFRAPTAPVPAFDGLLWLSGQAIVLSSLQLSTATRSLAFSVPNLPALAHANLTFQGLVDVSGIVVVTPPACVHVSP